MGRRSTRTGPRSGQTDPPFRGLFRLSLVSRDGPRIVRGCHDRGSDERVVHQRKSGPRRAARHRPNLPDDAPVADTPSWWMAVDDVHRSGRPATVLWRHLFSARKPSWNAIIPGLDHPRRGVLSRTTQRCEGPGRTTCQHVTEARPSDGRPRD